MTTREFIELLYCRPRSEAEGFLTVWCRQTKKSEHFNIRGGIDATINHTASVVAAGHDSYFGVGLRRAGLVGSQRGTKSDVVCLPGFWLDVDLQGPGHAAKNLPADIDAGCAIIESCPFPPTVVDDSGWGLHAFWLFETPLMLASGDVERFNNASKAFQKIMIGAAHAKGLHVDQTGNLDRVLRLPGTTNFKISSDPKQVSVLVSDPVFYDPSILIQAATRVSVAMPAAAALPPSATPVSPADALAEIKIRLTRLSNADNRKLMAEVLAGRSFARPGERDAQLQKTASITAFSAPAGSDPVVLAELFGPSLAVMAAESTDPNNPAPTIGDVVDKLRRALHDAAVKRGATSAWNTLGGSPAAFATPDKPHIVVDEDVAVIGDEAEKVLIRLGRRQPGHAIYFRGDALVDVITTDSSSAVEGDVAHPPNAPRIRSLPLAGLIESLSRAATWSEKRSTKEGSYYAPCWPPEKVAKTLESRGRWKLPSLAGVVETPTLVGGGRILERPGYDSDSGLLFLPSTTYPAVPDAPTKEDARRAIDELLEPLCDVRFASGNIPESSHDRSAFAALVITMLARYAIKGPVPVFSFSSPVPGSGKTLIATMAATIGRGRRATTTSLVDDETEMDKRLLAIAISGTPVVLFDDLPDGMLGTAALSRAVTDYSLEMEGRLLGQSRWIRVPLTAIFIATGNNIRYRHTLARRVVQCSIDPGVERPETRNEWKYPDVLGHVSEQRARLAVCALTVLRAHDLVGRPKHSCDSQGSFEFWDTIVRSAIIWTGLADPCAGREAIRVRADADVEPLRTLISTWYALFGSRLLSVAAAIAEAHTQPIAGLEFIEALSAIDDRRRPAQLGQAIGRWRDRVVEGLRFEGVINKARKVAEWRVSPASPGATQ